MAINPLAYTEKTLRSFLRYQLSAYPLADDRLHSQLRQLLSLEDTRKTPLLKGPFVSLSRSFQMGAAVNTLVADGLFHPHMKELIPYPALYGHQEKAIRSLHARKHTLISTGTGSGKSECFLYPIISRSLALRNEAPAITAVIVYPMNALAEDQLLRLRGLLAGTGVRFGMYVGKTPEAEKDVSGERLGKGASSADYTAAVARAEKAKQGHVVHPWEEVCSRAAMRDAQTRPQILLTNVNQLELLLTREQDVEIFDGARLEYLVFDEAHTFTGAEGAETACLIRRLRTFCGKTPDQTVCVATSATIADERDPNAARNFASRFFGVDVATIETVHETYMEDMWSRSSSDFSLQVPAKDALDQARLAVDAPDPDAAIRACWQACIGEPLPAGPVEEMLHAKLSGNLLLKHVAKLLLKPQPLDLLLKDLQKALLRDAGSEVSEAELIFWLTLGAAARKDGRPLVRPVVHAFLRGIQAGAVSFPNADHQPVLTLAAADDDDKTPKLFHARAISCTTCGQHYFEHFLQDYTFTGNRPEGGEADDQTGRFWRTLQEAQGGQRALFLDRLISQDDTDGANTPHAKLHPLWLCRTCGTTYEGSHPGCDCHGCGTPLNQVPLQAVKLSENQAGKLSSCICCGSPGGSNSGSFREPARPMRAVQVSDVHVLAQDMIQHADRKRLLIFADNRQDAAFQAGWMRDHARRYRLRALMHQALKKGALSIGDLADTMDTLFEKEDSLSRALLPEVWSVAPKEAAGKKHQEERQYFLRLLVLRELTTSSKQRVGLESWGRIQIQYQGLDASAPFIQNWANKLEITPAELASGIAGLLDGARRQQILWHSRDQGVFSRFWMEGDREIQNGYLPEMQGIPRGLKLTRGAQDDDGRIKQWYSHTNASVASQAAQKWGLKREAMDAFFQELWDWLVQIHLLQPVTLRGAKGNALPNTVGTHQVNGDLILIAPHAQLFRCQSCRRRYTRDFPGHHCIAWRCQGQLHPLVETGEEYDLQMLESQYDLLKPEEHTAMVPTQKRERIETLFKGESDAINTLVCTQTLEMGVDIGSLDSILLRNVPPLPANYWQRAGRAGRRHRMAVTLTYCRGTSHDRAYFEEPLKMLHGRVEPPSFHLGNPIMLSKHVHAMTLSCLRQMARTGSLEQRSEINKALAACFPKRIKDYLFDANGQILSTPISAAPLAGLIQKHRAALLTHLLQTFQAHWPEADQEWVEQQALERMLDGMPKTLDEVIQRLYRRLAWAMGQMRTLNITRARIGALPEEEDAFFRRCDRLIKKLKGELVRNRRDAEGFDDTNTYSVLASEGFLPGYGLDVGSVRGIAEVPRQVMGLEDFELPRPPAVALREYVPGNLIYANGQKFVARRFFREAGENMDLVHFEVQADSGTVTESTRQAALANPQATMITSMPVTDVTLVHQSRISDEEPSRFQMASAIYGREQGEHSGGQAWLWGNRALLHRKGVRLQMVNVGPRSRVQNGIEVGFPVCTACGQSASPFSSSRQRQDFETKHLEWHQTSAKHVGFHTSLVVDALSLPDCQDQQEAYSIMEALRFGAADVLDMELDDLQILVIGKPGETACDALLYDPMPGGSGLIDRICNRFSEVLERARAVANDCPSGCGSSCIDCLQTYRNAFYHEHLNRQTILETIDRLGLTLAKGHAIPAKLPALAPSGAHQPVNPAENRLRDMLDAAGFPEGQWQQSFPLGHPLISTTPDVYWEDPADPEHKTFVYLDGLSARLHGNPATAEKDRQITHELQSRGYRVLRITAHDLGDQTAMIGHFKRLARELIGRDKMDTVAAKAAVWFEPPEAPAQPAADAEAKSLPFTLVETLPAQDQYTKGVPVYDLKLAAGAFSEAQAPEVTGWAVPSIGRKLAHGMFVAQVQGKSMEPKIPDGSWGLFTRDVPGSRHGRILAVQHHTLQDAETGGSFTLKTYHRPSGSPPNTPVLLKPINPAFHPLTITTDDAPDIQVIGEWLETLGQP